MDQLYKYLVIQLSFVLALTFFGTPCQADIYRYVDADGKVHFTNTPTSSHFSFYMKEGSDTRSLKDVIKYCADLYRLEAALVQAVIKAESDFNAKAVSTKGALGLMQLLPETARDMGVRNPFDPEDNIRGGSRYLRLMLDQFNNRLDLALAAYNAGPGAVRRHGGIPPYEETRNYVERVKKYLYEYQIDRESLL
ncbi:lytic transglycosylase domain-containing protein [Desulfuromonas sp. AOP6]|uniref:lytic transglycosylase domain-containing protein n=1 Tax=Desulfuromonas sp. AOP6 TaxID=1566351 RepID=UPI0012807125|nr:lytic transglycosylase domain-containing protein [Desulfuromonas sp. AOP6]BCA79697.1 lytic transglycosylase [Desulfuromonas sp. AOP6]